MECSFIPQINQNGRKMEDEEDELGSPSSSSDSSNSVDSSSSDFMEDATSSSSSSSASSSLSSDQRKDGALYGMSSLMAQLPFKRGLSHHFQGKSQSFVSLSNVRCLEDLAKPERPYRKKLKPCRSYDEGGLDQSHNKPHSPTGSFSKAILKKPSSSKVSCSSSTSTVVKRQGFLGGGGIRSNRPPIPPQRSNSHLSTQTLLFA